MCRYSIRPHHLLCLQFFEGKGYSDDFVRQMSEIDRTLNKENPQINIVEGVDDICKKCPNNENGQCSMEVSVRENDMRTLDAVRNDLKEGQTWEEITRIVYKNIINRNMLKQVCKTCRWSDICLKEL